MNKIPFVMTPLERKVSFSIAFIYALRMLGIFIVLPIMALHAKQLEHASPFLVGISVGIYGLTQAFLQIPFGWLSDKYGRKIVIFFGLVIFIIGSIIAAESATIYGVVVGRSLQGAGAISAVLMSLAADHTSENNRTKIMAAIGIAIGFTFLLSLILGPLLQSLIGMDGIFWMIAGLSIFAIFILLTQIPSESEKVKIPHKQNKTYFLTSINHAIQDKQFLILCFGIFILHLVMTANFVVLPEIMRDGLNIPQAEHSIFYLLVLVSAVLVMLPVMFFCERRNFIKEGFVFSVLLLGLSELSITYTNEDILTLGLSMFLFFTTFSYLEAQLPSLATKLNHDARGTSLGIFTSCQFLGVFSGGAVSGLYSQYFDGDNLFLLLSLLIVIWFILSTNMQKPHKISRSFTA